MKYLKDLLKKSRARELFRFIANIFRRGVFYLAGLFIKIDDKQVLFFAYGGRSYACSPRAIYEELLKEKSFKDYKFIWAFKNELLEKHRFLLDNERTSLIPYNAKMTFNKEFRRSKYIIVNCKPFDYLSLDSQQILVQCWHGTPLKKLGYDIEYSNYALSSLKKVQRQYRATAKQLTYLVSPSQIASKRFSSAFALAKLDKEAAILEVGYPRNDFLYNYQDSEVAAIKKKLGIKGDKKVCLYAPTWRDNQYTLGQGYNFPLPLDFKQLRKDLKDDYVVVFRPHYFIADNFDFDLYPDFVYNGAVVDDINELYIIADILITDYSSVFFDYANLKRPIIFFMFDLADFKGNLRDFYLDIKELPGAVVLDQEALTKAILKAEVAKNMSDFNNKYTYLDDGQAAKRVINKVFD